MTDNDTTEAEADAPTADTGGAVEILRLMPPTAWEGMLVLGKIATDPKAFRRMLRALHDSLAAETEAQKKTRDERAAFEEYQAKETAELEQQKKTAASTWAMVRSREQAVEAREELERCAAREAEPGPAARQYRHPDDDGWTAPAGSGMSRTFTAPRTVRHDDLGQPYAAHTTLTRTTDAE
jgi:hypothetical protein